MTQRSDWRVHKATDGASIEIDLKHGGRLGSLRVHGHELLTRGGSGDFGWGCFVMAPFAGRLDSGRLQLDGESHQLPVNLPPHAIHGTILKQHGVLLEDGSVQVPLGPTWPVEGHVIQRYRLEPGSLQLEVEVHTDDESFDASCGWHPWFRRRLDEGSEAELHLHAKSMYERGPNGLPTGRTITPPPPGPWDDCFTEITAPTRIHWPGALTLTIDSDADYLVVYDERADALCVEPQTSPPNALTSRVKPGRPLTASSTWSWTAD